MNNEYMYSCLLMATSDRMRLYNSLYTGELVVEIRTNDDGTFWFVYDCQPDIEDGLYLDNCIFQIKGMMQLANIMIGGTSCV